MDGRLIPAGLFGLAPWPRSIVDDATTAQFDHRVVAYAVVLFALVHAFAARRRAPRSSLARRAGALAALAFLQAALGIVTLLLVAPIEFALAHQAVALLLFGMAVAHWRATAMERERGGGAMTAALLDRTAPDRRRGPSAERHEHRGLRIRLRGRRGAPQSGRPLQ